MRCLLLASACSAVVAMGPTALAQDPDIVIPIDTVVRVSGVLVTQPVPAELQGATCEVTAIAENNSSVHPDSNLIVTSGAASVTLFDVEREAGAVTTAAGQLTLGEDVTVAVEVGPDGVFSGGIMVHITCQSAPSPTPSMSPTPTETPSPTPTVSPSPTETQSPSVSPTTVTPSPTGSSDSPPPGSDDTSSPTVGPTTITSVTPPGGLAFTGAAGWQLAALGSLVLLVIGLGFLRAGYKRGGAS